MYVCETCTVAEAFEGLDEENSEALALFRRAFSRLTVETRAAGPVLMRLTADVPPEDFEDLMARLSILYDVYCPPPRKVVKRGA